MLTINKKSPCFYLVTGWWPKGTSNYTGAREAPRLLMLLSGEPGVGVALSKCHRDPGVVYPMAGAVPLIQSSGCFDYMCRRRH